MMTRISRIELYHVAIPLPATFYPSWIPGFPQTENRFMLIKVITEEVEMEYPLSPPGWTVEAQDGILEKPFLHHRGSIQTPQSHGLGFEINSRALKKYGRRFFVMDRKRLIWYSVRNRGLRVSLEISRAQKRRRIQPSNKLMVIR